MSNEIKNLNPKTVWYYFYQLTQIPRPSGVEDEVQAYMVKFGQDLGLETHKDETGNVMIRKPATPGMEKRKGVVLQGHLDMVPQANSESKHDFSKDPIDAYVDGDWVTANETTLGADNGMGVAAAMAILASTDIEHGPIEALFTSEEETGMNGAFGLKAGFLQGDILMNLDSEDEGELYVGCAGGIDGNFTFEANFENVSEGFKAFKIAVTGLKGGHSGMDIILERGNANKIIFRYIKNICDNYGARLCDVQGGSLRNAIPREAFATIVIPSSYVGDLLSAADAFQSVIKSELNSTEPDFSFTVENMELPMQVLAKDVQSRLIKAVYACPNGVIRMSQDMPGLTETSTNLAVVKSTDDNKIEIQCLLRSSVDSAKHDLANSMASVFELAGAKVVFQGEYPGWKPNMDSAILKTMQKCYEDLYAKTPEIKAIHAGLECGLLGGVYPNWDMISFGPTIRFPHSPDEKVNIESVAKFYEWLKAGLRSIPEKNSNNS